MLYCLRRLISARVLLSMSKPNLPPGVYLTLTPAAPLSTSQKVYNIENNPMFARYAEKLKHLKESDPALYEERMSKLKEMYQPKQKSPSQSAESTSQSAESTSQSAESTSQSVESTSQSAHSTSQSTKTAASQPTLESEKQAQTVGSVLNKPKTLGSIMKLDLLQSKAAEEISQIWFEFHGKKNFVYATLKKSEYQEMLKRVQEFPTFLYPVPKQEGYEFFFQQFNGYSFHFTTLAQYQAHKENAPVCLSLEHYTELMEDKGIVLMRGEPNTDIIGIQEAQLLAMEIQAYYGSHASEEKRQLVRQFNKEPSNFKYQDLLLNLNKLDIGSKDKDKS